jgi:hypothetical protein
MKTFPFLGDKGKFTFKAEYFNLINWTNLQQPTNTLSSPALGSITNAGDPRIGQFALRYDLWTFVESAVAVKLELGGESAASSSPFTSC